MHLTNIGSGVAGGDAKYYVFQSASPRLASGPTEHAMTQNMGTVYREMKYDKTSFAAL